MLIYVYIYIYKGPLKTQKKGGISTRWVPAAAELPRSAEASIAAPAVAEDPMGRTQPPRHAQRLVAPVSLAPPGEADAPSEVVKVTEGLHKNRLLGRHARKLRRPGYEAEQEKQALHVLKHGVGEP